MKCYEKKKSVMEKKDWPQQLVLNETKFVG